MKKLEILKKKLRDLKINKAALLERNPQSGFTPNGKAEEFIKIVGSGKTFISFFSGGNGTSKTATGSNIVAHICYGLSGNPYFNLPLFKDFPYPKRGRIISDPTTAQNVIVPELKKWFPKGCYKTYKKGKNYEAWWRTNTKFSFDIMTYEQAVSEFESATLGWAWFDEAPPQAIFKATVARMRRGGIIFITATPLTGSAWLYDHIVAYQQTGKSEQRDFVFADIEENCVQHGIRGFLEHKHIEKMIAEYTEDEKQARVHGKFAHLTGLIFKTFNRKVHVIKPFTITKKDYIVTEALDPHPRNPDAVMWMATNKNGDHIVCNELYGGYKTGELAERIKSIARDYRIEARICDPLAFTEDQHQSDPKQQSLARRLSELDLDYQPATKDRIAANRRIDDALYYEKSGEEMISAPELYIFDTCQRTIWELEHYQWDDWRGKVAERKSPKETPQDKDDHMIENLGRLLLQEPEFIPPPATTVYKPVGVRTNKEFDPFD